MSRPRGPISRGAQVVAGLGLTVLLLATSCGGDGGGGGGGGYNIGAAVSVEVGPHPDR
ncbi:hypothetical protein [Promicromonospora sp. NPDC060271]|uniref:hypothetical protein n=1 Tax=Promicromonospora sp. NPDC060271 TaxID=3347089 RepID=UPI0036583FDA